MIRNLCWAAALVFASGLSSAQAPCPLLQPDCSRTFARLNTTIDLAAPRPGDARFNYAIGGLYGDLTPAVVVSPASYQVDLRIRGSESVLAEASAFTSDGLVFANAAADVDLKLGRIRAKIDGFEAVLPPQSLFESAGAEIATALQDTVLFRLPSDFAGGRATFVWTVDGSLGAASSRTLASDPTFAEARVSAGGPTTLRRWTAPGSFLDVLTADTLLPALPGAVIPITFTSQVLLRSGAGAGGFDVDLYNTAALSIVVPEGVTWSSQSGLLLTAVPEPASVALFAVGFTLLLAWHRRRNGRPVGA